MTSRWGPRKHIAKEGRGECCWCIYSLRSAGCIWNLATRLFLACDSAISGIDNSTLQDVPEKLGGGKYVHMYLPLHFLLTEGQFSTGKKWLNVMVIGHKELIFAMLSWVGKVGGGGLSFTFCSTGVLGHWQRCLCFQTNDHPAIWHSKLSKRFLEEKETEI